MRLLILASWYRSPTAPTRGSFVREQAIALARRGHEVHLAYFDRDSRRRPLSIERRRDGAIEEYAIAVRWPLHRLLGFYFPWPLARAVRRLVAALQPDVVHAHAVRPAGVVAALAARGSGAAVVLTEHSGPLTSFWWTPHGCWRIASAYAAADALVAVSEALRREMQRCFPRAAAECATLHNGIDTELFVARPRRAQSARLLYVGALAAVKRVDLLLGALARMRPDARLTIVGAGPLEGELKSRASRSGVAERVSWLGSRSRPEVAALMAEHDVLVVPSDAETFSLVCAEALACGTPVVATRCGGPEEVVPPFGGLLVPPGSEAALAEAIEQVLDGRFVYDAQALRQYVVERFSMDTVATQLDAIYHRVCAASPD